MLVAKILYFGVEDFCNLTATEDHIETIKSNGKVGFIKFERIMVEKAFPSFLQKALDVDSFI